MKLLFCGLAFVVVLTVNLDQVATAATFKCLKEKSKNCVIPSLIQTNPSEEVYLPDLRMKTGLQIVTGSLNTFSEKLSRQLGTVEKLQLGPLQLKEIFLKPELQELSAGGNQIEVIKFKTTKADYGLELLDLRDNRLRSVDGFEVLVNLVELNLEGNVLESVDLWVFHAMSNLKKLYLQRNQLITVLATELIDLPALEFLSLSDNKLTNLDVTNWQLESLTECNVSSNDLVHINGLERQFPSLQAISMSHNGWHCLWLDDTLKLFNQNSVNIKDQGENCEGKQNVNNICCDPVIDTDITEFDEVSKLGTLRREQTELREALNEDIDELKSEQESKLKKLEAELRDLEQKAKKLLPFSAADSLTKSEFVKLKERAQKLKSTIQEELNIWDKQTKQAEQTKQRLQQTITEQRRTLEREMRKISESQAQFGLLRDYVSSKLRRRN